MNNILHLCSAIQKHIKNGEHQNADFTNKES